METLGHIIIAIIALFALPFFAAYLGPPSRGFKAKRSKLANDIIARGGGHKLVDAARRASGGRTATFEFEGKKYRVVTRGYWHESSRNDAPKNP